MTPIHILIILIAYLLCARLAFGLLMADWTRSFGFEEDAWDEGRRLAFVISIAGPIAVFSSIAILFIGGGIIPPRFSRDVQPK